MKKNKKYIAIPLLLATSTCLAFTDGEFDDSDEFGDFYSDAEFISIATGTKTSLNKAPAIASVITASDLKKRGVRNLVEALSMIPGLNVSRNSQIMSPKFNFRGITSTFSPQTLLMIDGTPLKSIVRGDNHITWGRFPIHSIERIEIIRGPGSALYGADAFAGVINVITKGPEHTKNNSGGISAGSFNRRNAWFNSSLDHNNFEASLNVEYSKADGHKNTIQQDAQFGLDVLANQQAGLAPVSLAPGPVNLGYELLDVFVKLKHNSFRVNLGIQERKNLGTGQGVTEALDPIGKFGGHKYILDVLHETPEFQSGWKLKSKISYYRSAQEVEQDLHIFPSGTFFGTFPDGLIGNPEWQEDNTTVNFKLENNKLNNHSISIGIGYSQADLFEVTERKNFFPDLSPRPNGVEDVSDTDEIFIPEASRNSRYIFAQDIWQLAPDWELTTGLRWDQYSDIGSTINPRLALVWSSSLNSTTKLLYGRAFRAPAFAELLVTNNPVSLGNPNLSPEIIDTYELGYSIKPNVSTTLNFNIFYYHIEDLITFVPDQSISTATAQNVGERDGYGIELESIISLSKSVHFNANYSFVKAKDNVLKSDVGDYPEHQFNAILDWNAWNNFDVNTTIRFVGDRGRSINDSRNDLDGFIDLSINMNFAIPEHKIDFSIGVKNLLDDDIFEPSNSPNSTSSTANIPFDLPQAGIAFHIELLKVF
jgi:iron complex outermembrane receptor protein